MSRRTTPNRVGSPNRTDTSAVGVRSPTRMYRPPSREAMQLERLEQSHQHQMTVELEAAASSAYRDEVRLARQQQLDAKRGHVAQMRESVYQRSHASRPSVASQLEATRVSDTLADDRLHAAMEAKVGRLTYLREHARATRLFAAARCELKRREAQQASLVTLQSLVPEGDDRQRASTPLITVNKQQQQQQQSSSSYLERQQQSRQRTVRDTMRLVQRQDQKEVPRHVSSPPAASRSSSPPRRESSPDRRMNIDDGVGVDWTGAGGGVGSRPVSRAASTPMNASSSSSRPQLLRSSSRQSNRSIASNQSTSTMHRDQFLVQHKRVSSRSSSSAQERRASLPPLRNSGAPSGSQASASSSQHSGVEDPTDSVDHVVAHARPSAHHRPPPPQERRPNSRNEDEAAKFQSHSRNMLRHLLLGPSSTSSSLDPLSAARTVSQQKALHHQMERSSISTSRNASIVLQMSKAHVCPPVFCAREGVEAYRTSVESSAMQQAAATLKALGPTRAKPSTPSTAVVVARRPLQAQGRQRRANPPDPIPESVDWLPATVDEDVDEADAATPQPEMPLPYPTHHRSYYYDEDDANEEENVLVFPMHASLNRDDRSDGGGGDSSSVSPIRKNNNNGGGIEEDASHLGYVEDNDEFTVRSDNDVHRQIYGSGSSTSTFCSSDDEDEDEEERRIARNKEPEHHTPREQHAAAAAAATPSHSPPVEDLKMAHLMQEKRELVDLVKREERVESQIRSRSPQKEPTSTSSGTEEQHEATASTRAFQSVDDEHVRRREELETLRHKLIAHHGGAGGNAKTYAHHPTNDFSGFDSDHSANHQPLQTNNNNNNNNNLNAEVVPAKKYSPIQEDLSFDAMCFVQGNFEVQRLFTPPPHVQVSASSQGRGTSLADVDEEDNPFPKPPSDMAHFMDFGSSSSSSASSSRSATPPPNGTSPRAPSFGNVEEDRCLDQTIELEEEVGKDVVPPHQEPQPRQQVASSSTSQQQHELFVEDICETVVANAQERHSRESSRGEGEEPASSPELHEPQNEGESNNLREVPPQQLQSSAAASTRTVVTYPSLPSPVAAMTSLDERPSADVSSPLSAQWSECSMSPHTKAEAMRSVEWCSEEEEGEQEGSWRSLAKHTVLMVIRKVTDKKQAFLK